MAIVHISEAEAAKDFAGLLAHLRAGEDVVIDGIEASSLLLTAMPIRSIAESLQLARERGSSVTLDDEFGRDLEAIIAESRSPGPGVWD